MLRSHKELCTARRLPNGQRRPIFIFHIIAIRVGVDVARDIIGVEGHLISTNMVLLTTRVFKVTVLLAFLLIYSGVRICHAQRNLILAQRSEPVRD